MIYIKLDESMTLAITVNGPIYRGDHLAEKIVYLTPKKLNEIDMTGEARLYLSYIRADGTADIVLLNRTDKLYNETYCQFVVPVTCDLTKYPGEVCTWLTVFAESPDCCKPAVAKSGECMLRVMASKSMDAYLDDAKLTALYQMQHMIDENDPNGWTADRLPANPPETEEAKTRNRRSRMLRSTIRWTAAPPAAGIPLFPRPICLTSTGPTTGRSLS